MKPKDSNEWEFAGDLYAEIEAMVNCLVKCVNEEVRYRCTAQWDSKYYHADLHEQSKAAVCEAREALKIRLWKVCKSPGREAYRSLATEKRRGAAILEAQSAIVGQVFNSMNTAMDKMREKYEARIAGLRD